MNQLVGRSKMNQLLQQLKKGSLLKGTKLNEMENKVQLEINKGTFDAEYSKNKNLTGWFFRK